MTVIAMTREMGTRGIDIAAELADRLGARVVHQELLDAAQKNGGELPESEVFRYLEGSPEESARWKISNGAGGYASEVEILELAARGNVIIRGWGATRLLRGIGHVLSVRVCAPMSRRVEEMIARASLSEAEAKREIQRSDATHGSVLSRIFKADWRDAGNYDLIINTARTSTELGTRLVLDALDDPAFQETPASRQHLFDRLLKAKLARRIGQEGTRAKNVHVSVTSGDVRLYGIVNDASASRDFAELVREVGGINQLSNELVRVAD